MIMKPIVVGVAGTAKNTGKTTVIAALLEEVKKNKGLAPALSSIGYDGEELDNITGLPKPRITVFPGMLAAVAEKCLQSAEARAEVLTGTDIRTPLGKIVIVRVVQEGRMVLAGPNKAKELAEVLKLMAGWGANLTIIDGALNRIAPLIETDGLIIATGAARSIHNDRIVEEIQAICGFFRLPEVKPPSGVCVIPNVLAEKEAVDLVRALCCRDTVILKGIISQPCLDYLLGYRQWLKGKGLIFSDPLKLILSGEPLQNAKAFAVLARAGVRVGVMKKISLAAVTVNPYYPLYCEASGDYAAAYVDSHQLFAAVREASSVPVYDVVRDGAENLFQDIININQDIHLDGGV